MSGIFENTMASMNWVQIRRAVEEGALVLLPLGVLEEHGPHLPLSTDVSIAHGQCLALRQELSRHGIESVIAPPFYWGVCQCTGGFIGSFQVRRETATALLYDILASLAGFGFTQVYGVNAHGDIEHAAASMDAFRQAREQLGLRASVGFPEDWLAPFGLTGEEPWLFPVAPASRAFGDAVTPDVHAGDLETAAMVRFCPGATDGAVATELPPVALPGERAMDWLFGGHIQELSHQGYLGNPAAYAAVDVDAWLEDTAHRLYMGIMKSTKG